MVSSFHLAAVGFGDGGRVAWHGHEVDGGRAKGAGNGYGLRAADIPKGSAGTAVAPASFTRIATRGVAVGCRHAPEANQAVVAAGSGVTSSTGTSSGTLSSNSGS